MRIMTCFSKGWGEFDNNDGANMCDLASFPLQETTEEEYSVKEIGQPPSKELCKNLYCKNLNIKLKKQMQIFQFLLTPPIIALSEDSCFTENSEKCLFASKDSVL